MSSDNVAAPSHEKSAAALGLPAYDEAVWIAFDAAVAVSLGWQKHLGHVRWRAILVMLITVHF